VAIFFITQNAIEKSALPQRHTGGATVGVTRLLFPLHNQPRQVTCLRGSLQQKVNMVGHEAVRKNGKAVFVGTVD
jgi:hypothetical protein